MIWTRVFGVTEHRAVYSAVRSSREAAGLSLRSLAAAIGVSPATLSAIERGHTSLTVERLHQIADVLGVPAAQLLRGQVPPRAGAGSGSARHDARDWRRYDDLELGPILGAAKRLFVRQGFHATSMREVAAESGVSVAGIYHHYSSKEKILLALLDVTMTEILWRLAAARDEGTNPQQSFMLMVESLALFHAVRGDLAFIGASEMRGLSGTDLPRVRGLRDDVQHHLDEQAALAFPGAEVRTACRAIATMCTSLPTWFRLDGAWTAQEVARQYSEFAVAMVRQSARESGDDRS